MMFVAKTNGRTTSSFGTLVGSGMDKKKSGIRDKHLGSAKLDKNLAKLQWKKVDTSIALFVKSFGTFVRFRHFFHHRACTRNN
jgi:hypothetical protein